MHYSLLCNYDAEVSAFSASIWIFSWFDMKSNTCFLFTWCFFPMAILRTIVSVPSFCKLFFALLVSILTSSHVMAALYFEQATDGSGLLSIEVERFHSSAASVGGHNWVQVNGSYAGGAAMQALPEDNIRYSENGTDSARLNYEVEFAESGTHYVWVRGLGPNYSSDSMHVGLNGVIATEGESLSIFEPINTLVWSSLKNGGVTRITINVPQPGRHTLNLWMRESGIVADKLVLTKDENATFSGSGPALSPELSDAPSQGAFLQSTDGSGLLAIEAEHFDASVDSIGGHQWTSVNGNYSGGEAVQALPEDNIRYAADEGARLDYSVEFTETGLHYVWVRALGPNFSSDSVHVGLNGNLMSEGEALSVFEPINTLVWSNSQNGTLARVSVNVPSPGAHVLNLWMRESGVIVDKLVLTLDSEQVISAEGPQESPQSGITAVPAFTPPGGNFTESSVVVGLDSATPNASIYYTTDGSQPTTSSTLYVSPFQISSNTTVKAFATSSGASSSAVVTEQYTFNTTENTPPVLASIGNRQVLEGQSLDFAVSASDVDGDIPNLYADLSSLPGTPAFVDNGDGTANFSWSAPVGSEGSYSVTVTAEDALDSQLADSETFTLIVTSQSAGGVIYQQATDGSGLISLEAENYKALQSSNAGHDWVSVTGDYSGGKAMQATPDDHLTFKSNGTSSARMDFDVNFVETGLHYVWVRALGPSYGADSVHVGLDGVLEPEGEAVSIFEPLNTLVWSSTQNGTLARVTINVQSAGVHTLNVWMRESGVIVDKVVVVVNESATFSNEGPPESGEAGMVQSPVFSPVAGHYTETPVSISLETATSGASVYYTLDGSNPSTSSTLYNGPFNIFENKTVKAIAVKSGSSDSGVVTAVYTLGNLAPVMADPGGKQVQEGFNLGFEVSATDADGDVPYLSADLSALPGYPQFIDNGDGTGSFDWDAPVAAEGTYTVSFTAADAIDPYLTHTISIEIYVYEDVSPETFLPYGDSGGIIIEAENYLTSSAGASGHSWQPTASDYDFSGRVGMEALPEDSVRISSDIESQSPRLDYQVSFPDSGTYYIWVRASVVSGSSDSIHLGLDGVVADTARDMSNWGPFHEYVWSNTQNGTNERITIDVPSAGVHQLNIWMRESGTRIDKILITADAGFVPVSYGPSQSPQGELPTYDSLVDSLYYAWRFDDSIGDGETVDVIAGSVLTCSNCPGTTSGKLGGAFEFNGFERLQSQDAPVLGFASNQGFSLEFIVRFTGNDCAGVNPVISHFDPNSQMVWWAGCENGKAKFSMVDDAGNSASAVSSVDIDDGGWHYVAAVQDYQFGEVRIYVDGELRGLSVSNFQSDMVSELSVFNVGWVNEAGLQSYMEGSLDELAIHNRALSDAEISRFQLDLSSGLASGFWGCDKPVKIMPLGDSITEGTNKTTNVYSSYRPFLYNALSQKGYNIDFVGGKTSVLANDPDVNHEGEPGITNSQVASEVSGWLAMNPADIILMHLGTNGLEIGSVDSVLDAIDSANQATPVVVGKIINRRDDHPETTLYNDSLQVVVEDRINNLNDKLYLVDHESALIYPDDLIISGQPSNILHPNAVGAMKMADIWEEQLVGMLPRCSGAAPEITPQSGLVVSLGGNFSFTPRVLGHPLGVFGLGSAPNGMIINAETGEVRWTATQYGSYNFTVLVDNGIGQDSHQFVVTVSN